MTIDATQAAGDSANIYLISGGWTEIADATSAAKVVRIEVRSNKTVAYARSATAPAAAVEDCFTITPGVPVDDQVPSGSKAWVRSADGATVRVAVEVRNAA